VLARVNGVLARVNGMLARVNGMLARVNGIQASPNGMLANPNGDWGAVDAVAYGANCARISPPLFVSLWTLTYSSPAL